MGLKEILLKSKEEEKTSTTPPAVSRRLGGASERAMARAGGRRSASAATSTEGNPQIIQMIDEALSSGTKLGFGELNEQLVALSEIPDENQRLSLAVKTAGAAHKLELPDFIAAVAERIEILKEDKEKFDSEISEAVTRTVQEREQELTVKTTEIEEIDVELARLQDLRHQSEVAQEAVRREIAEVRAQSETQTTAYNAAHAVRTAELNALLARLQAMSRS